MKTEIQIVEEIIRLRNCIEDMKKWIIDIKVGSEDKAIYENDIIQYGNDIERLYWVLEEEEDWKNEFNFRNE